MTNSIKSIRQLCLKNLVALVCLGVIGQASGASAQNHAQVLAQIQTLVSNAIDGAQDLLSGTGNTLESAVTSLPCDQLTNIAVMLLNERIALQESLESARQSRRGSGLRNALSSLGSLNLGPVLSYGLAALTNQEHPLTQAARDEAKAQARIRALENDLAANDALLRMVVEAMLALHC